METMNKKKFGKGRSADSARKGKSEKTESLATRFKKYFGYGEYEGKDTWLSRNWWLLLALAGIFLLGLFMRSYFYYPMAHDMGFSGNDPYYHKRVVDYVQQQHTHLIEDPMLNYPVGGVNPRPPVYNWFIAIFGIILSPIFGFDVQLCTNTIMYLAPSFWGAMTIFPVYFLTKEMFGKKTGVISAFIMATMPSHIERSPAGFSDHDSIVVFFVVLSIFLLFRAFGALKHRDWVKDWRSTNSIYDGFTEFLRSNQVAICYALLSGVSLATIALTWKGFPYAIVIIIIYYLAQLLFDRFRHVDSTGVFVCTFLALFTGLAVSFPYYATLSFGTWSTPFYFLAAVVVIGVLLIPTRDYPWIIVLPLGIIVSVAGYLLLSVIAPAAAEALVTGQGYFVKSKLYSTIAEAQPPEFSRLIVSYAIVIFFFAIIGIVRAAFQVPKHWKKEYVFIVVWAIVAVYMAMAAVRFMFNATPVIAITAGWILYDLVKGINIKSKVLIPYTLLIGLSMLLLAWWGTDHGYGDQYTWLLFMGVISMVAIPIIMAVYDNYDKRPVTLIIGGMLAVWTVSVIVMVIVNEDLKWGTLGDVLAENTETWFFGLAALGIMLLPVTLLMAKKGYAFIHMGIITTVTLMIFGLRSVGSFDELFNYEPVKVIFSYSLLPLIILTINTILLYLDKNYGKDSARRVFLIAMEIWVISFFFDPSPYTGIATFALLAFNIYLLTPYRKSFKHKTRPMHVVITLFIVLMVLVPHVWFAIDASLPYEKKYEMNAKVKNSIPDFILAEDASQNKYFGAFGHGFTSEYWRAAFDWLSEQDTELEPDDRPGFVSWWDYGFWCAYLGAHPTAADNFQFGYQFAGSFISAQNESEAISLMIARTMEGGLRDAETKSDITRILSQEKYFGDEKKYKSNVDGDKDLNATEKIFEMLLRPDKYVDEVKDNPEKYGHYLELLPGNARYAAVRGMLVPLGEERITDLMTDIEKATDKCIRYFAVDYRLFPFTAQNTGIFYAPIKLADKDVEDFLEYIAVTDEGDFTMPQLEKRIEQEPEFREKIREYRLKYTDQFYNSMFYRCYIGYSAKDLGAEDMGVPILSPTDDFRDDQNYFQPMQGWNMSHFKQVYKTAFYTSKDPENASFPDDFKAMNTIDAAKLYDEDGGYHVSGLRQGAFFLKYYHGAYIRGKVRTEGEEGYPMPGVRVTMSDEFGIPHDECVTDGEGNYNLTAPFGESTITVSKDGYEESSNVLFSKLIKTEKTILNRTSITITDEQSMRRGDWIIDKDILLKDAWVTGKIYYDTDYSGEYELGEEMPEEAEVRIRSLDGRNITYTSRFSGDEYNFTEVLPANYEFIVTLNGHNVNTGQTLEVTTREDEKSNRFTKDLGMEFGNVSGNVTDFNLTGAPGIIITLTDNDNGTVMVNQTNETGFYRFEGLLPGNYTIILNETLYSRSSRNFMLENEMDFNHDFTLIEIVPVMGRIFFDRFSNGIDDGDEVPNARLIFTDRMDPMNTVVASSDLDGRYMINLSLGNYTAYAHYVDGDEHLAFIGGYDFRAGLIYDEDIVLSRAARVEGTVSLAEELLDDESVDENATKGVQIIFRRGSLSVDAPTNGSSMFVAYLPEGEYDITAEVFLRDRFAVGSVHIAAKGGETLRMDIEAEKGFPVQGFVFWDMNGDMNLTIGGQTHDIRNITSMMRNTSPMGETPPDTTEPLGDGSITETVPTRSTRGDDDDNLSGTPLLNVTNTTGRDAEIIYENLTPGYVDFIRDDVVIRAETNETGFFAALLPEGTHTMVIESNEVERYTRSIVVGEDADLVFVPPIRARNITFDISLGIDRDYGGGLTEEELLKSFEIDFIANSTGASNASFEFRKGAIKRVSLLPGRYDVRYRNEFILSGTEVRQNLETNITLPRGAGSMDFEFFVEETVRFSGSVVTSLGDSAVNVTLKMNSTTDASKLDVVCDANGNFDRYLPQGRYFVQAKHVAGSQTYLLRSVLDVSPGNTPFTLTLVRAYELDLTLYFDMNQDGQFQSKEKQINTQLEITGDIRTAHTTNYNGELSVPLLPGKSYSVIVDHLSSDSTFKYTANISFSMPSGPHTVFLPVMKYVKVKGDLYWDRNEDGKFTTEEKIAGGSLAFEPAGAAETYETITDADGKWSVFLPLFLNNSQSYDIEVRADGYEPVEMVRKFTNIDRSLTVPLSPKKIVYEGIVFKDRYDNNVKDANETGLAGQEITFTAGSDWGRNVTVISGPDGSYVAELLPGDYVIESLFAGEDVYLTHREIKVNLLEDTTLYIALERGEYVYGSVRYFDSDDGEHRLLDVQDNLLMIEGDDNGLKRELLFTSGYFETYLPHGRYNMEMKGITVVEYDMDMVYKYDSMPLLVDEDFEPVDVLLHKKEDTSLDMSLREVLEGEDFETTVNQGEMVGFSVKVVNTGNVHQDITLTARDLPEGWAINITPSEAELPITGEITARIKITTGSDALRVNELTIKADSYEGGAEDIPIKINTHPKYGADVYTPDDIDRGFLQNETKSFDFAVKNTGNAADDIKFYLRSEQQEGWNITIQNKVLNSTGFVHRYSQDDEYKNLTLKVKAPNMTLGMAVFEIGVESNSVNKVIVLTATITKPDIIIDEVRFKNLDMKDEDENVTVYITLRSDFADVGDFNLTVYLDDEKVDELFESIDGISEGKETELVFDWNLSDKKGKHRVDVYVDEDDRIAEKDDINNNHWSKEIVVAASEDKFNWRIVIAIAVVVAIIAAGVIIWKKKQLV